MGFQWLEIYFPTAIATLSLFDRIGGTQPLTYVALSNFFVFPFAKPQDIWFGKMKT
jgi:hypothetical protein